MIDLPGQHLAVVRRILAEHVPEAVALAYGSRVRGTARPVSDLDIALRAAGPLPVSRLEALRDAFAASDLPFLVDVVDYNAVSAAFRQRIDAWAEPVFPVSSLAIMPPT
ncbi:nucleotidyltransferase family protein [Solidesulfovibrio sp.]